MHPTNGTITAEELDAYFGYVEEFMTLLKQYVPGLLKDEEFFREAFDL